MLESREHPPATSAVSRMRRASTLLILGTVLSLAAGSVQALGFGRIGWATTLGQQLSFSAIVRLEADETLGNECVGAEVFSGENKLPAGVVRLSVEPGPSATERIVRVTTTTLLDEPVVTVSLGVGCGARLSRRFVVFLDPPVINLAQSTANEPPPPAPAAPPRAENETAPQGTAESSAAASALAPAPVPVRQAVKPRPRPNTVAVRAGSVNAGASPTRIRKPKVPAPDVSVTRAAPPGSRLKLEAPVATAAPRASEAASAAPLAAAMSAASQAAEVAKAAAQSELIAKERERLQALEDSLARLRAETQATQKTLLALQTRLKGAESERFTNPVVYALAGLCAALLFAVAAMWRRHRLREASWWASPASEGVVSANAPLREESASVAAPAPALATAAAIAAVARPSPAPRSVVTNSAPAYAVSAELPESHAASMAAPPTEPLGSQRRRELSVEELIDLEQQAEFFVVLGQDEAAIDLLMGHLRSTGGSSPLPYLKLLEIYRRRGEREPYDRTRERFNRRFNAYAPDWESDPQDGRSLEDYPETIAQLQTLWSKPPEVIELLDASLFRRDVSIDTFDVPAYRELVLLYSVVRDIAEHDGTGSVVDLLLPIDAAKERATAKDTNDSLLTSPVPFVSVTELSAADRRPPALDLDISAVRAFERPVDIEPTDFSPGSNFLGLVDDPSEPDGSGRRRR